MTRLNDVDAAVEVTDGRVTMTGRGGGDLYVGVPSHTPLSRSQLHATLRLASDGFEATIELDADECAALATALEAAPEEPDADDA